MSEQDAASFAPQNSVSTLACDASPKRASAIDDEREKQHNSAGAAKESAQEDAEEQEEEKNPAITNPHWETKN